jgi:DinB superfamily
MTNPDENTLPTFFSRYVDLVRGLDVIEALVRSAQAMEDCLDRLDEEKGNFRYAENKWTVKELVCHVIDADRIFAFRALTFARGDKSPLPGFEENEYAPETNAEARGLLQLNAELQRLGMTHVDLFGSFTPSMLQRSGVANGNEVSVVNLGYILAGHKLHHVGVINERYFPT